MSLSEQAAVTLSIGLVCLLLIVFILSITYHNVTVPDIPESLQERCDGICFRNSKWNSTQEVNCVELCLVFGGGCQNVSS